MENTNPQQLLSQMYYDMQQAKSLLLQVTELQTFSTIMNAGEGESINQIIGGIERNRELVNSIQLQLNSLQ